MRFVNLYFLLQTNTVLTTVLRKILTSHCILNIKIFLYHERQNRNRRGGIHHRAITEQSLARESRYDCRNYAKRRQDHDIDLGMAKEPEHVLEHDRIAAASGIEKRGTEMTIGEHHRNRPGQYRHDRDQQVSSDQPGPHEQRHLHQGHARGTHVEDGGDDVDRPHHR